MKARVISLASGVAAWRPAPNAWIASYVDCRVQPTEGTGQEETSCKQWLVDRYLGAGEASAMYGKPGDGLAEDMGLHVAAGAAGTWEHSNATNLIRSPLTKDRRNFGRAD
jgi:hypothetical protein